MRRRAQGLGQAALGAAPDGGHPDGPGVLDGLAGVPRERLVLVQNGFLEAGHGDLGEGTRGLVWFTSKQEFFLELQPSLFFGPRAADVVVPLGAGGLRVGTLLARAAFLREMIQKGLWNCAVGLPLAAHGVDLATYLAAHGDELRALLEEGARRCAAAQRRFGLLQQCCQRQAVGSDGVQTP